jgi:hypothetical protein
LLFKVGTNIKGFASDVKNRDPLFINSSAGDYKLQSSSPAIDSGIATPSVPTDKDDSIRPQGSGWDIGAYEYSERHISPPRNLREKKP